MPFPCLFLSPPRVVLPALRLSNQDVIDEVRSRFRGADSDWPPIEAGIRHVFDRCGSAWRHLDRDPSTRVAAFAARAARLSLDDASLAAGALDLVLYGGIAREYLEPATAMELSHNLGVETVHAFDVTSACVGLLEAIHVAAGRFAVHDEMRYALIATGELTREYLAYDVQTVDELTHRAAGLTIGNAAASVLIGRTPFPGGSGRLVGFRSTAVPRHFALCQVPVGGAFTSFSADLFRLHGLVPPEIRALLADIGWSLDSVDHFVFHQPSDTMLRRVVAELGVPPERAPALHSVCGNTVSAAIPVTLRHLLDRGAIKPGDRVICATAAAGLSIAVAALEWCA